MVEKVQASDLNLTEPEGRHIVFAETPSGKLRPREIPLPRNRETKMAQKLKKEFAARKDRTIALKRASHEIQTQRQLMQKGRRTKIKEDDVGNAVYRWKAERRK